MLSFSPGVEKPGAVRSHESAAVGTQLLHHFTFEHRAGVTDLAETGGDHHDRGDLASRTGIDRFGHQLGAHHDDSEVDGIRNVAD